MLKFNIKAFMEMEHRLLKTIANGIVFNKHASRKIHLTKSLRLNPNFVNEIRIPVPWGHIAGKWWGDTNKQPILALHGWQDNAGTFDRLLELFPSSKPVLAIDLPGQGFSSHYPEAMRYHIAESVMVCRRVQKYFGWNQKITLLGHSGGGAIAFLFSAIYPEFVNGLIALDVIKPYSGTKSHLLKLGELIDISITKSRRDPNQNTKYPFEEILKRWIDGTRGSLTEDAVKILMRRGVQLDEETGKYSYTRDPKLKLESLHYFDENQSLELATNLKCHYLAIRFSEGKFVDYSLKNSPTFIATLNKAAKTFKLVTIEGTHHAHLTTPDRVAPVICEFIKSNCL